MKKIIFIITTFVLCGLLAAAQTNNTVAANADSAKITKDSTLSAISRSNAAAIQRDRDMAIIFKEKVTEIVRQENASLKKDLDILNEKLYIVFGISMVLFILVIVLFVLFVMQKKNFRSNLIKELENCQRGGRMENFVMKIAEKAKVLNDNPLKPYYQPSKDIKRLNDIYLPNKHRIIESSKYVSEKPKQVSPPSPQSLYAKTIVDGKFSRVQEYANDETIFELKLSEQDYTQAKVIVYAANCKLVVSHPEFLDGCEVLNLGNTSVTMLREGAAVKENDGKWRLTTIPEIKIS